MWPRNSVNLDDFCENRRFPGFGLVDHVDGRVTGASVREFRRFAVDHEGEDALS